jgi:hypothetical protein
MSLGVCWSKGSNHRSAAMAASSSPS